MPSESLYGEEKIPPTPPPKKAKRKTKPKKPAVEGFLLRVQAMGSNLEIVSPIPRDQFVEEMVETITNQGANPEWSGWYHLKKADGKIVSVRLRSIDVVEEM
jgi:hypothetical protein|tara:strand:+ start:2073 stop:2378 length:306 start_codon:yes stop_codon:yes gene_type:complete